MPDTIIVTDTGLAIASNLLSGLGGTVPSFIGSGTGTTPAAHGDTALEAELSGGTPTYARAAGTPTRITVNVANDTVQIDGSQTYGTSDDVAEAGLFDALTSGILFARSVFSPVSVLPNGVIDWTWKITLVSG